MSCWSHKPAPFPDDTHSGAQSRLFGGRSGLGGRSGVLGHTGSAQRPHGRALRADWRVRQPHDHLLAHVFQMTGFTWEHLGSRVDFGYGDAQKTPRSPNTPDIAHRRARVPHGTHRDLPRRRMTSQDRHDGTCLPGRARRQQLLAVSHADQSWVIASSLSRRPEEIRSHPVSGTGTIRNPWPPNSRDRDGKPRQPPAAKPTACRVRRGPCGQRDAQLAGPMFHRSGLVRPYVPPVRSGPVRSGPAGSGQTRSADPR